MASLASLGQFLEQLFGYFEKVELGSMSAQRNCLTPKDMNLTPSEVVQVLNSR